VPEVQLDELVRLADQPSLGHRSLDPTGGGCLVADVADAPADVALAGLAALPAVFVAVGVGVDDPRAAAFDVVVDDWSGAVQVEAAAGMHPSAAAALAVLLRGGGTRTTTEGLVAESSTYSALQAGAEHKAWLAAKRPPKEREVAGPAVRVERDGDVLTVTLARPEVHNAFDAATRDGLLDALAIAEVDPTLRVELTGEGPSFCSGGDLDEFGSATDPALAHLLRLSRSVGAALDRLAHRVTVHVHGACIGAGIELPAFAGRIVARRHATFALPELGMGLVPGAGGTVSIPRRIGHHRTAWWALTGARIDTATALEWGLVDEVTD
jgi:hypothetical protein